MIQKVVVLFTILSKLKLIHKEHSQCTAFCPVQAIKDRLKQFGHSAQDEFSSLYTCSDVHQCVVWRNILDPVVKHNWYIEKSNFNFLPSDTFGLTPLSTKLFVMSPKIIIISGNPVPFVAAAIKPTTIKRMSTQSA